MVAAVSHGRLAGGIKSSSPVKTHKKAKATVGLEITDGRPGQHGWLKLQFDILVCNEKPAAMGSYSKFRECEERKMWTFVNGKCQWFIWRVCISDEYILKNINVFETYKECMNICKPGKSTAWFRDFKCL